MDLEADLVVLRSGLDKMACFSKDALMDIRRSGKTSEKDILKLAVEFKEGYSLLHSRINGIGFTMNEMRELQKRPAASALSGERYEVLRYGHDAQTHLTDFISETLEAETSRSFRKFVEVPTAERVLAIKDKIDQLVDGHDQGRIVEQIDITVGNEIDEILINLKSKSGYKPKYLFDIAEKVLCRNFNSERYAIIVNRTNITGENIYLIKFWNRFENMDTLWHQDIYKLVREESIYLYKKVKEEDDKQWTSDEESDEEAVDEVKEETEEIVEEIEETEEEVKEETKIIG